MKNQPDAFDMKKAMELAASPEGRMLLAALQKNGGQELQKAIAMASGGDYSGAREALSALMDRPDIQKLMEQLGGNNGRHGG